MLRLYLVVFTMAIISYFPFNLMRVLVSCLSLLIIFSRGSNSGIANVGLSDVYRLISIHLSPKPLSLSESCPSAKAESVSAYKPICQAAIMPYQTLIIKTIGQFMQPSPLSLLTIMPISHQPPHHNYDPSITFYQQSHYQFLFM